MATSITGNEMQQNVRCTVTGSEYPTMWRLVY